ncbi:MAG: hypothetical protein R2788_13965 [Saprospiraceae bacterium]
MNNLLGSTALGMIDEANIPLLLIPPTACFVVFAASFSQPTYTQKS